MELKKMKLSEIKPYGKNPRKNDGAVDAVAESIKQCGYCSPIVVDENYEVLAGHTRLKALKKLGRKECEVVVKEGLTEEQKQKYRILDNKTGEFAEWDFNVLDALLPSLDFDGFDFGFEVPNVSPDDFGDSFSLPDGDKGEFVKITFTLHKSQADLIENVLETIKRGGGVIEYFGNKNKNGNAIYEVCKQWDEQKKSS